MHWMDVRGQTILWDLLQPQRGQRVLDAGCGDGRKARRLTSEGLRVWAVDFAPRMVAAAAEHAERAICADIQTLDLDERFDRVLCTGVLDFVPDPAACVERLARHVGPGGRLVIEVPRRSILTLPYAWWQRLRNQIVVNLFEVEPLDAAARQAGLTLVGRQTMLHTLYLGWTRPL